MKNLKNLFYKFKKFISLFLILFSFSLISCNLFKDSTKALTKKITQPKNTISKAKEILEKVSMPLETHFLLDSLIDETQEALKDYELSNIQKLQKINKLKHFLNNINFLKPKTLFDYRESKTIQTNKLTHIWIKEITDGDTFVDSENRKYRFAGVDTPETKKRVNNIWKLTNGIQYKFGLRAKNYISKIINEKALAIYVLPFINNKNKSFHDHYKRILAKVYYLNKWDNKFYLLNEELIAFGLARMHYISLNKEDFYYTKDIEFFNILNNAKNLAQTNQYGIYNLNNNIDEIYPN
ncbi:thermonuclease family protein [Mycoplasma struthionis]|uniref:thermonuclease family protein n=1 Tax=Mycoplasma struthionis TaxID=538220 RepID=UPI001648EDC2|nr:thermonuclease family protein [Mycoplasma struthionis]